MTRSTKETYFRLIRDLLIQISKTPENQKEEFLRLKKKLNKYHKRYESL